MGCPDGQPAVTSDLNNHHRDTLRKIFDHQAAGNVEWREVISLLKAVGTVQQEHNGKLEVTVGPETEVLRPPHGKDVDAQMLVDLRRMLAGAGLSKQVTQPTEDERSRDFGDGRWGEQS